MTYIDLREKPDWFLDISPHGKVPVLSVGGRPLFESNAIAEFLDEMVPPRLHPEDPFKRARNRAWTDFVPDFSASLGGVYYAGDDTALANGIEVARGRLARLEEALARERGNDGPYFNGAELCLVDAAYAPFLRRYAFVETRLGCGLLDEFPLVQAWSDCAGRGRAGHRFGRGHLRARVRPCPAPARGDGRAAVRAGVGRGRLNRPSTRAAAGPGGDDGPEHRKPEPPAPRHPARGTVPRGDGCSSGSERAGRTAGARSGTGRFAPSNPCRRSRFPSPGLPARLSIDARPRRFDVDLTQPARESRPVGRPRSSPRRYAPPGSRRRRRW